MKPEEQRPPRYEPPQKVGNQHFKARPSEGGIVGAGVLLILAGLLLWGSWGSVSLVLHDLSGAVTGARE